MSVLKVIFWPIQFLIDIAGYVGIIGGVVQDRPDLIILGGIVFILQNQADIKKLLTPTGPAPEVSE